MCKQGNTTLVLSGGKIVGVDSCTAHATDCPRRKP